MKLEDQVCSLELAKRLKELGVKQKTSYFTWIVYDHPDLGTELAVSDDVIWRAKEEHHYSAFSVAELGEMLPREIIKNGKVKTMSIGRTPGLPVWYVSFGHTGKSAILAEAMGKVIVYLLENQFIKL